MSCRFYTLLFKICNISWVTHSVAASVCNNKHHQALTATVNYFHIYLQYVFGFLLQKSYQRKTNYHLKSTEKESLINVIKWILSEYQEKWDYWNSGYPNHDFHLYKFFPFLRMMEMQITCWISHSYVMGVKYQCDSTNLILLENQKYP